MSNDVDDFLVHYGVKGMKWGRRKKREPSESNPENRPSRIEKRDAKRKAKSDAILKKADEAQAQVDDLNKNGTSSKYMVDKYGKAMAIDSLAADMRIFLLNGQTKKSLLNAEIAGFRELKSHHLADANAAANGRMTNKQKQLLGAAAVTVLLAGALGAAAYTGMKETNRLEAIKAGDKISWNDYFQKLSKTETKRVAGISRDAFDKMDDSPISVPAGTIFKRVSTDKEDVLRDSFYAAFKDDDVTRYKAALPQFWNQWGITTPGKEKGFVVDIAATKDIVSPSQKQRVKSFIDLLDEPITGSDMLGRESTKLGRQWLAEQNAGLAASAAKASTKSAEELGLENYRNFALNWAKPDAPLVSAYFKKLKEQGFNSLVDDNDAGKLSDQPMLIFEASKTMKRVGETVLSNEDIQKARDQLVELASRG